EVRSWFFEVWNEPNLRFFFDGSMKDYFHLYELTARAIKGVDAKIKVGGPATSNNMWIPEFRAFCEENDVPYDFITTHHYPSDDPLSRAGMNGADTKGEGFGSLPNFQVMPEEDRAEMIRKIMEMFRGENKNPRDVLYRSTKKVKEEAGDYPVYYTEWNAGHYDETYAAAGILATLAYNEGLVEGYSYWCISDIFEEQGLNGLPFNNEFGLVTVHGVRKPSYRIFEALHQAGDRRLTVEGFGASRTAEVLPLTDGETVTLFVYNHDIEARDIKEEEVELTLLGDVQSLSAAVIDSKHANPLGCWETQGKPEYPTKTQLAELELASQLVWENIPAEAGRNVLKLKLEPESAAIVKAVLA
ncbi:MAG: beta-xylosidase, partial [Lachnospiraceae bacterium]|nr:beta-xylosidase [Lachnospiraceae bacterium]